MKRKISIPLPIIVVLIIVAIVILAILIGGFQDKQSKLSKVYEKMIENQTYVFTRYDFEKKHMLTTYRKGDKTLIDIYNPEEHLSTLVMNGDTYLISHDEKEYYVYINNALDEEVLTDSLKNIINLEYTVGREKIYGKSYKYEEYVGVSNFLIAPARDIEEESIRTRFYFKGNDLVYLKTIYNFINEETGEKIQEEELQTVKVGYNVEDSVFELPKDYAEN